MVSDFLGPSDRLAELAGQVYPIRWRSRDWRKFVLWTGLAESEKGDRDLSEGSPGGSHGILDSLGDTLIKEAVGLAEGEGRDAPTLEDLVSALKRHSTEAEAAQRDWKPGNEDLPDGTAAALTVAWDPLAYTIMGEAVDLAEAEGHSLATLGHLVSALREHSPELAELQRKWGISFRRRL